MPQKQSAVNTTGGIARGPSPGLTAGPRLDDLPGRAARSWADRSALIGASGTLTFRQLDEAVTACGAALTELLGPPGAVVAIAAVLDPVFAVAYYGTARARHVSALLNPLLPGAALTQLLARSGGRVAVLTEDMWDRVKPLTEQLPQLQFVLLTGEASHRPGHGPVPDAGGAGGLAPRFLAEVMAGAQGIGARPDGVPASEEDVACIMFTSGTTGAPKAVALTHRNLTVNAAQTAEAQELDVDSVMFNHLPTLHTMHLNAGLSAGATHVLHDGDDPVDAVIAADAQGATHFYSLPVRLARLAADPRLAGLSLRPARALLSGGSALPSSTAKTLSDHFGLPVVQGYGLAEMSPLTHFNRIDRPRAGSCGQPLAGTECRVVDVASRAVLPVGQKGEIQLRGPQRMAGYLGTSGTPESAPDEWFSTGDVGRIDEDGFLYLTDRLKDVFKCDNFLVSPAEVEEVLRQHEAVADCVVVDQADPWSGAVAYALVVLRDTTADLAEVTAFANDRLPYFSQLRHTEQVDAIPRSPNGKLQRQELRKRVRAAGPRHTISPPTA